MKKTERNFSDKSLQPKRHPVRQKLMAVLLCICLLLVSLPMEFYGFKVLAEGILQEVVSFSPLSEEVQQQTVDVGTNLEDLNLPNTLTAVCVLVENKNTEDQSTEENSPELSETEPVKEETIIIENVTWTSETAYDNRTEGTYVFIPVIPENFRLTENVELPEIKITVIKSEVLEAGHQSQEENQMEGGRKEETFSEDEIEREEIAEDRILRIAEEEESENIAEEPACGEITTDTVWKEGNLGSGTVTIKNNATLTITGQIGITGTVTIQGEGTIVRENRNAYFGIGSGNELTINGKIVMEGNSISGINPFIDVVQGKLIMDGECTVQNVISGESGSPEIVSAISIKANSTGILNDVIIENCSANYYGGAIENGGNLTINGGIYENNTAAKGGGCIWNGLSGNSGNLTINGGKFQNNEATERGGCIYSIGGNVTINQGIFSGNKSGEGGCIYSFGSVIISDGTFTGNKAESNTENLITQGGCIYVRDDLTIEGGTFTGNTAIEGGCIYSNCSTAMITGGNFNNNTATNGGCIYNANNLVVNGGVFNNNTSSNPGGAIYSSGDSGKFYLYGDVEFQGIDDNPTSFTDSVYSWYLNSRMYTIGEWLHPIKVIMTNIEKNDVVAQGDNGYEFKEEDLKNLYVYDLNTKQKCYKRLDTKISLVHATITNPGIYNIYYDKNGAEGSEIVDNTDYQTGEEAEVKSATGLKKEGYIFKEWNTQQDGNGTAYGEGSKITITDENITLYAIFEKVDENVFTANFYSGGEGQYESKTSTDGTILAPNLKEMNGWNAVGWSQDIRSYESDTTPKENLTLTESVTEYYGIYKKDVILTYDANEGDSTPESNTGSCFANVHQEISYQYAKILLSDGPSRSGYQFVGWNTQEDGTGALYRAGDTIEIKEDTTLYAFFEEEGKKTLIADFYSGESCQKESRFVIIDEEETEGIIQAPELQQLSGWTTVGWGKNAAEYTKIVEAGENCTLTEPTTKYYGIYRKSITLSYDNNGEGTPPEPETRFRYANVHEEITYQEPEFILAAAPARAGYEFKGWNTESDGTGTLYEAGSTQKLNQDIILYAIWEEDVEIVNYQVEHYCQNLEGNGYTRIDADTTVLTGRKGTEVTARPKKYTGFTVDLSNPSGKASGIIEGDGSLILKFYYDRNIYEVEFNLNGGYGTVPETQKIPYGGLLKPTEDPVKAGYNFKGWYLEEQGMEAGFWDFESPVENNTGTLHTTLYAKWEDELAPVMGEASFDTGHRNFLDWVIGKESLVITVPVTEEGSGLAKAEYLLVSEDDTEKDGTAQIEETRTFANHMLSYGSSASVIRAVLGEVEQGSYEVRVVIEEEFKGKVYLTCTDQAGNVSARKALTAEEGIIIEDDGPEINFINTKETTEGKPVNVGVVVRDDKNDTVTSGISRISYQIDKKKVTLPKEEFAQDIVESYDFKVKISGKGTHTLRVEAEDHAGNKSAAEITLKINEKRDTPAEVPNHTENSGQSGKTGGSTGGEPKTGDSSHVKIYATVAMIAGFSYLLLYFEGENGITEQEKEEILYRLVEWAKGGGILRRLLGLAVIFLFLAYYHSIGKSVNVEWREVCMEKTGRNSGF